MKQKLKKFAIDSMKAIGICMAVFFVTNVILEIVFPYTPYVRSNPYRYSDAFHDVQMARIEKEAEAEYTAQK